MEDKIELFKYIVERNKLNKIRINSYKRYRYNQGVNKEKEVVSFYSYFSAKKQLRTISKEKTIWRRQLAKKHNTKVYKNGANQIKRLKYDNKVYFIEDIERIVGEHILNEEIYKLLHV
jgi:hypothetical protein